MTPSTGLSRRAILTTEYPSSMNFRAVAAPILELAPLMMAVLLIAFTLTLVCVEGYRTRG